MKHSAGVYRFLLLFLAKSLYELSVIFYLIHFLILLAINLSSSSAPL